MLKPRLVLLLAALVLSVSPIHAAETPKSKPAKIYLDAFQEYMGVHTKIYLKFGGHMRAIAGLQACKNKSQFLSLLGSTRDRIIEYALTLAPETNHASTPEVVAAMASASQTAYISGFHDASEILIKKDPSMCAFFEEFSKTLK